MEILQNHVFLRVFNFWFISIIKLPFNSTSIRAVHDAREGVLHGQLLQDLRRHLSELDHTNVREIVSRSPSTDEGGKPPQALRRVVHVGGLFTLLSVLLAQVPLVVLAPGTPEVTVHLYRDEVGDAQVSAPLNKLSSYL